MGLLFISFAVAMAAGTFIENKYNTDTARIFVYNAWWFEAIMLLFVINFLGNIRRYGLYKKKKWSTLLLHLAFILIIIGAAWTRYISFEGKISIREGATNNQVLSDKNYLTIQIEGESSGSMKTKILEKPLLLSPVANNHFSIADQFDDIPFEVSYSDFILNATPTVNPNPNGELFIKIVEATEGTRHDHYLPSGEALLLHKIPISFNNHQAEAINIRLQNNTYTIQAPVDGTYMQMDNQKTFQIPKDSLQELQFRTLYIFGSIRFVLPAPAIAGDLKFRSNHNYKDVVTDDALIVNIESQGQTEQVVLMGTANTLGTPQTIVLGDLQYTLTYGSKIFTLPFQLTLNDFIAEKYPGTEKSYSSFESRVTVKGSNEQFDTRIYMNNVLDHKGYRFFQSSFHPDEKGTILSVNHDFWGTWITYIGYGLLYIGLLAILFDKHSRFGQVKKRLQEIRIKKANLTWLLLFLASYSAIAATADPEEERLVSMIDSTLTLYKVDKHHAEQFGKLIIQDAGGRMKPVNTFSMELLRKVSKRETYNGLTANQVMLSMAQFPQLWYNAPLISLKRGNNQLRDLIGIDRQLHHTSLTSFFNDDGEYKLAIELEEAYKAGVPNQIQKDLIETDRKVNLLYYALTGNILKLFPVPDHPNNKWVSTQEASGFGLARMDSIFITNILPIYFSSLKKAAITNTYDEANSYLVNIKNFQKKHGKKVYPSDLKINLEVLYNQYDVFKKLFSWYMYSGVFLLFTTIICIFISQPWLNILLKTTTGVILILFMMHTIGLVARTFISGHAPWSDAYESMIYVGWATMFFGLLLGRKSYLTIASTTFVASMILMIAHWNWMDPAIANLQPVLNSYWLMIHVAVIVASYGPFTLGMVLGLVALLLMVLMNRNNRTKIELNIKEIVYIAELALTVGLIMLTIGNFLGGQWANESWGRYWGWDPKETWALISIMIYAFVIHTRLIPGMKSEWLFSVMCVIAFYSIMMTYFGVNFYLTGLHSYANGDKVVTPSFVYYSFVLVGLLSTVAYLKKQSLTRGFKPKYVEVLK